MTRSWRLSAAERRAYEADGYLIRESVFGADDLTELREAAERAVEAARRLCDSGSVYALDGNRFVDSGHITVQFEHAPGSETVRVIEPVHDLEPRFDRLIDDERLVAPMRDLVGCEDVALWTAKLNLKRPNEGSGFRWHQDSPYWIHDSDHVGQLPNVLIAFDQASAENGCLRVVRGSHSEGCLPGLGDGSQLEGFFTDPDSFDASAEVPMEVPAGSLVFFSPHVVHGSLPNRSSSPRRAIILTYQPGGFPTLKSREHRPAGVGSEVRVSS